jgi:hypothetical protein
MSRLGQNASPTALNILRTWGDELGEAAGAIATRNRIVELATQRVDADLRTLANAITSDNANIEACMRAGAAYSLPDGLPFSLVADLDSFLFETRSAYELMVKFIWIFLRDLGSPKATSKAHQLHSVIAVEIAARNGEAAWIESLRSNRHLFIHETAAWPALQIASLEPFDAELVLLTRNVMLLNDPSAFISLQTLREIYRGFNMAFSPIEEWLSAEIDGVKA